MSNAVLIVSATVVTVAFFIGAVVARMFKSMSLVSVGQNETRLQLLSLASDLELPSHTLASGISDPSDLQYVRSVAPKLRNIFMKDRVRLARLWLRENRHQLSRLMRLHRLIARHNVDFRVSVELRVIGSYVVLQALLLMGDALILVAGPFHTRRLGLLSKSIFFRL
jgi:hypothetical protein